MRLRFVELLVRLSQCVWTTTPRGTVDQELKYKLSLLQLVRMVKIIRCRRPEALALHHYYEIPIKNFFRIKGVIFITFDSMITGLVFDGFTAVLQRGHNTKKFEIRYNNWSVKISPLDLFFYYFKFFLICTVSFM